MSDSADLTGARPAHPGEPTVVRRYAVAAAAPWAALLIRLSLGEVVRENGQFIFFVPAVMLAAWYGGLGPGLLATAVGSVLCDTFLPKPTGVFATYPEDFPRLAVFLLVAAQVSWLGGALRASRLRAEADARAARRNEALYRTLARNVPHAIIGLFDANLRAAVLEGAGLAEAGLGGEDVAGRPVAACVPAGAAAAVEGLCRRAVGAGGPLADEVTAGDRTYFVQAVPLAAEAESPLAGLVIVQDVTARARAQDALRQAHAELEQRVRDRTQELNLQKTLLELQAEASQDAVLAADDDGRVIHANGRFRDVWGLDRVDVGGPVDAVRRAMRARHAGPLDPLGDGAGPCGPVRAGDVDELALRDGRTLERYGAPIVGRDGTRYGRVWFFRDTTERKRLERAITEAGDRERQRIGQDLHDDLCQHLSGIACLARVLEARLTADGGDAAAAAREAHQVVALLQEAAGRARDLARGLQPVWLRAGGLDVALGDLCDRSAAMFGVACEYHGGGGASGDAADGPTATHLYRIAQEAIHNAVRHGRASAVRVDLVGTAGRLILTVEDNGVGLPAELPRGGVGLHTMSFRARMIGASLSVERGPAGGTVVTCAATAARGPAEPSPAAGDPTGRVDPADCPSPESPEHDHVDHDPAALKPVAHEPVGKG
jgi:signal transduction histidine kinase